MSSPPQLDALQCAIDGQAAHVADLEGDQVRELVIVYQEIACAIQYHKDTNIRLGRPKLRNEGVSEVRVGEFREVERALRDDPSLDRTCLRLV
jgi:hypothetical protein